MWTIIAVIVVGLLLAYALGSLLGHVDAQDIIEKNKWRNQ